MCYGLWTWVVCSKHQETWPVNTGHVHRYTRHLLTTTEYRPCPQSMNTASVYQAPMNTAYYLWLHVAALWQIRFNRLYTAPKGGLSKNSRTVWEYTPCSPMTMMNTNECSVVPAKQQCVQVRQSVHMQRHLLFICCSHTWVSRYVFLITTMCIAAFHQNSLTTCYYYEPKCGALHEMVSLRVTAPARFMLSLIHRGRIIHGVTYFDDTCQPTRHGFSWAPRQGRPYCHQPHGTAQTDRTDAHRTNYI